MHLHSRTMATLAAAVMAVAMAPLAVADSIGPGPVRYSPLSQPPRSGILRPGAVRHHTLVVQPVYAKMLPDVSVMHAMAESAKKFWEREVPGLTVTLKYLKPVRFAGACARTNNRSELVARKVAPINPYQTGNHLLTYVPECGFSNAWGSMRNGSGTIFVGRGDSDGTMLAHEFGHNLGLHHADLLSCRQAGSPASLAKTCTETEYANPLQVMGNSPIVPGVRAGPLAQSLITGRVATVDPRRGGSVTLSAVRAGGQAARLTTPLGIVYFGATQDPNADGLAHLVAEVATRNGSALVQFPDVNDTDGRLRATLVLGNSWDIPGSPLRAVVTHATATGLSVSLAPRTRAGGPPVPAVVAQPPNGQFPSGAAWRLSWAPSPSKDVVAYWVRAGSEVIARVNGDQSSAEISSSVPTEWAGNEETGEGSDVASLSVEAISRSGRRSASAPITVTPVDPSLSLSSSLGAVEWPVASAPFTLTWAMDPMHAGSVASWELTYAGTTTTLPAGQNSIVIDPATNPDPEYGDVELLALDSNGYAIEQAYYWFYTPLWASESL